MHDVAFCHGAVLASVVLTGLFTSVTKAERPLAVAEAPQPRVDEAAPTAADDARNGPLAALRVWNDLTLETVRATRASDADAARTYAMVNVAVYDAANALRPHGAQRESAIVAPTGAPAFADVAAATGGAAHAVLRALFPEQASRFDDQLTRDRAGLGSATGAQAGFDWGASVGAAVVSARTEDGARPIESEPAGEGPGVFRAAWSDAQYRNLTPFAIVDPARYVSAPPPALDSVEYAAAFAEVKILGSAGHADPEALASFQFWALPAGTDQPPGEWLRIALEVGESQRASFHERTRLLALVSIALADVVAPTFMSKFEYRQWRPATAIREADTDDNPLTEADPRWSPRAGGIGGNPQHTSGHSSFSAAASTVLAGFFCRDDIPFTHLNDGAPNGQPRSYRSFSAAALEAGRSRIQAGVHFEFSNQAGLEAGRGVGAEVLARALLRKRAPTHLGSCPL